MARIRTRTRKNNRQRKDHAEPVTVLEDVRNRRFLAFVRAIVGAARHRNTSR